MSKYDSGVSWNEATLRVATMLLDHYKADCGNRAREFVSGSVPDVYNYNDWFHHILSSCDIEDLKRFSAHGITKGSELTQLQALLLILNTGLIQGDWALLAVSGYIDAYTHGGFTIIAPIDQALTNQDGRLNVGAIVVNAYFEPMIPTLTKNFSDYQFLKAEEFPQWVENQKRGTRH